MLYTMRKQVLVAFMSGFPNLISASLASQGHGWRVGWVAWVVWVDYCDKGQLMEFWSPQFLPKNERKQVDKY